MKLLEKSSLSSSGLPFDVDTFDHRTDVLLCLKKIYFELGFACIEGTDEPCLEG